MATRVVLDRYEMPAPSYCWRNEWISRYESAYSLLSKFALLNALSAKELAGLLVVRGKGLRSAMCHAPNLALHDAGSFDLDALTALLHLPERAADDAFLPLPLMSSDCIIHPNLRFCPRCMDRGFHAVLFQLEMMTHCPIHGRKLVTRCPHCKEPIPYRLQRRTFAHPYACPHCKVPLAAEMKAEHPRPLVLDLAQQQQMSNVLELVQLKQNIFTCAVDMDHNFAFYDHAQFRIARPLLQRKKEDYFRFLDAVISRWSRPEVHCGTEQCDSLLWLHHSGFAPKLKPHSRQPSPSAASRNKIARPWYEHDEKFWSLVPIYKAIRRHIWRHLVARHKACIYTVARAFWWAPDGLTTPKICPMAYAFLQWRAFWEGFSTPQHLFLAPTHAPFRLLAWLSDTAPYCSHAWPRNVQEWLTLRIFAIDCINSFYEWMGIAKRLTRRKTYDWSRELGTGHALTYWAAAGEGSGGTGLLLAIEKRPPRTEVWLPGNASGGAHYRWHVEQTGQVASWAAEHQAAKSGHPHN